MFKGCADDFHCTNQGQSTVIDGVDDAEEMNNTRKAFSLLGKWKLHFNKVCMNSKQCIFFFFYFFFYWVTLYILGEV